jgi:hypothetical protein
MTQIITPVYPNRIIAYQAPGPATLPGRFSAGHISPGRVELSDREVTE